MLWHHMWDHLLYVIIFTNDTDIASYADGNTLYTSENTTSKVIQRLKECSGEMLTRFENNGMKANPEKCHLLVSKKNTSAIVTSDHIRIYIIGIKIECSLEQRRLGVIIDNQLTFKTCWIEPVKNLVHIQELHTTWTKRKGRIIMSVYINSKFFNWPLVWMIYSKKMNNKVNRTHELVQVMKILKNLYIFLNFK